MHNFQLIGMVTLRKRGNSNSKNDSRPYMGASAFLKSVDFRAFAVNVKTIALGKYLYQFGHAIWWGDLPTIAKVFLESYDFSDKTVIPFCTHAGSGLSGTQGTVENLCTGAAVEDGLAVRGTTAQNEYDSAESSVTDWLRGLGLTK